MCVCCLFTGKKKLYIVVIYAESHLKDRRTSKGIKRSTKKECHINATTANKDSKSTAISNNTSREYTTLIAWNKNGSVRTRRITTSDQVFGPKVYYCETKKGSSKILKRLCSRNLITKHQVISLIAQSVTVILHQK